MSDQRLAAMAERLERLEANTAHLKRDASRMKIIATVACAALVGVTAMGAATISKTSTPFGITDARGVVRTRLDATGLHVYDANGKQRILVGFNSKGMPAVHLDDKKGTTRESMYLDTDQGAAFAQSDGAGNARNWQYIASDGAPIVELDDAAANAHVYINGGHNAFININGDKGQKLINLGLSTSGKTGFHLFGEDGKERGYVGDTTEGVMEFDLYNGSGTKTAVLEGGDLPFLGIYSPTGVTRAYLGYYTDGTVGSAVYDTAGTATWNTPNQ